VTANTPTSEGCPDAAFLKATATARITLRPESQTVSSLPASTSTAASLADAVTRVSPYRRRFRTDPPLSLLPALRI
jgi:hypothetical protein